MIWFLLALACAPRIWQQTTWEGDDTMATGVVCQSQLLEADEEFWVRVSVRHDEEVQVDWQSASLNVVNAEVVKRELGPERVAGPRTVMRYDTYWVKPTDTETRAPVARVEGEEAELDVAALGPYEVLWRPVGREDWVSWTAQGCTARLR